MPVKYTVLREGLDPVWHLTHLKNDQTGAPGIQTAG